MMAGSTLGFPFTAAQWKELETQAMIYKYMVASVPVPYELLLPIIQNLPPSISPLGRQLRYSTKQDLEPGRCKRTDGKKWRCSRDVAPNQKYCERHLHRGRPRSRKHVELSKNPTNNKTPPSQSSTLSSNSIPCKVVGSTILPSANEPPFSLANMHSKRGVDWSMEGGSEQQWGQIMKTSSSLFNNEFGEEQPLLDLSSFTTTDFGTPTRRDFIDAWSTDKNSVAKDAVLCVSVCSTGNLDLSMGMGMGLLSPLAEVLGPNSSSVANPTSPSSYPTGGGGGGDSLSPPPTTVSSPSGVLHRTMLSLSDGSVCNSPTLASTPTDTVAFQWFT